MKNEYPKGLKPGDFIQTTDHFGDVYFEVKNCWYTESDGHWNIDYYRYPLKQSKKPEIKWVNSASSIRKVIPAEMAIPYFIHTKQRFHAANGKYDPFIGFIEAVK